MDYPKRLIEVDLPIARISAHARREKSIRHGHISTLHIWWARRPLAACRAVICAALWPDPADPLCPQAFRDAAAQAITAFAKRVFPEKLTGEHKELQETASKESLGRWVSLAQAEVSLDANDADGQRFLRGALLDFIADFANWDNSTVPAYLETSRALTQAAHESLGGARGTRPLVVDPFAGGGSIPLEALRVGADAFASDLNPVPVLLNKVLLESIPRFGQRLADGVRKWGEWIKCETEKELTAFYPKDPDGASPIAYLWARTIQCEGPSCGAEVPLIRSLWLVRKETRAVALQLVPNNKAKRVDFQIILKRRDGWVDQVNPQNRVNNPNFDGTVKRGSATCPCCGYTTPVARVREQLYSRHGGTTDARLLCVVITRVSEPGRFYRLPEDQDVKAVRKAAEELERRKQSHSGAVSVVPNEPLPPQGTLGFRVQLYGMLEWGNLFSPRQALALTTLIEKASHIHFEDSVLTEAVQACIALAVGRLADRCCALCTWDPTPTASGILHLFSRQAIPMIWDFAEGLPLETKSGGWLPSLEWVILVLQREIEALGMSSAHVAQSSATSHPLPDDSANAFITDPPYYDAVPYADLSDFFYVWLKRSLFRFGALFQEPVTPKVNECIVDEAKGKDRSFFEETMKQAMVEGRRVLAPTGIGVVVFAHKSTAGWEAQLQAMIEAGWIITGSWPIDTEMGNRLRAMGSAALASSVHLVCRPRENTDGSVSNDEVGDWRDVLAELPHRIHSWMPRLAEEGVVGADAIFSCLGPALEVFSRYSRVEKASGEAVPLREYLEQVWAAVSTEALSMIFHDADAVGLEPDARLTAMWLWTLGGGSPATNGNGADADGDNDGEDDDEVSPVKAMPTAGFILEFDAARKIAQGLGIHLEKSESIVEVRGDKARLLPVSERTRYLFGKDEATTMPVGSRKRKKTAQMSLFAELDAIEAEVDNTRGSTGIKPSPGETVLDRVHQAMILFAGGRGEALRRFLVEDGAGTDARFWKLAQSLSALYPAGTDEKRWVDGVLARKKGLGL